MSVAAEKVWSGTQCAFLSRSRARNRGFSAGSATPRKRNISLPGSKGPAKSTKFEWSTSRSSSALFPSGQPLPTCRSLYCTYKKHDKNGKTKNDYKGKFK